jgi:UDP-N-acetylmuramoyl-L-alanyl-D-glutamate--2,6-diaminopimelate ligase
VERELALPVAQVVVPSVRWAMGQVASCLYEHPSARLPTIGITGTNGKTTTAFLTAFLFAEAGRRAGLLSTVERRMGGTVFPAERTTPEPVDIQRDLAFMVDAGDQAAVMEVSSHALDLGRVAGISFTAVAFTNLTQDHLDYHGTIDAYFAAKSRLFLESRFAKSRPVSVVNVDDPFGRILAERLPPDRLLTVSCGDVEGVHTPDLELLGLVTDEAGLRGSLTVRGRALAAVMRAQGRPIVRGEELERPLGSSLLGRYNAENVLVALAIGVGLGLDFDGMVDCLPLFPGVPGRLERVDEGAPFTVVVDYAHTPDSVENVLRVSRGVTAGSLITVLGCGGDRDHGKRPLMGRAAEQGSDILVVTSDNPRSERPGAIIADIVAGLENPAGAVIEADRRAAIGYALRVARDGDMVLILGKGHEVGQEFADHVAPFDDRLVAREIMRELDHTWGQGRDGAGP